MSITVGSLNSLHEIRICFSTRPITNAEITLFSDQPGFLPNTVDLMHLAYGERAQYSINTNVPNTLLKVDNTTFGSGTPSAQSKIHWTRVYHIISGGTQAQLDIYPTNAVLQMLTSKEKDLVWMERLRRSYILQGE